MRQWGEEILPMSAGGCDRCAECAYPEPCRDPENISYSVSAFGLLVNEVCRDNGVRYYYGSDKMAFTGMILFGEKEDQNEILDRIASCAIEGKAGEMIRWIHQALEGQIEPQKIAIAMTERFLTVETSKSVGEQDLSKLLQGARTTSRGMEVLRPYLQGNSEFYRYTAIIGTASGDLHDLGKNLVAMMLEVAGFRVVDLGIDISAEDFARAVSEDDSVRLVGVSCLLTTSLRAVEKIVAKLNRHPRRKGFKVTVGGGATDAYVAKRVGADAYTNSAVDAAEYAKWLLAELKKEE
jgi:methylmalonyl-CoA mutase cobalamin-binding domain/chain